jgi:alpha-glucoside transport system substrate-binding protein
MRNKKLVAGLTAVAMAFGACAQAASPSPAPSTAPSTAPSASAGASGGASPSAAAGPNAELAAAMAGEYRGQTIDILTQWIDAEGKAFDDSLKPFRDATGINVIHSGISNYETVLNVRVEGGLAPDIAQLAQSGNMRNFQGDDKLIPLTDVLDMDAVQESYSEGFIDAGSVDGTMYGLYYKQDLKSIVWYPVQQFSQAGYTAPKTAADLQALEADIVADGSNPWCTTIEHGDVSGWVLTDWIEDVLLRTAPPETYDAWAAHTIPFNDPAVLNAANIVKEHVFTEGFTYGGNTRVNATWVGDSQTPMFDAAGPKCWLHKQAAWIPDFWPKDANNQPLFKPGEDSYAFFYFPPIDEQYGSPVLGGSDMLVMFKDRPEVRAIMQWFSTPESVEGRVATGGFLSASNAVPLADYTSYPMSGLAEIAQSASVSRPDASDSMPAAVGGPKGIFLAGMVKWTQQNGEGTEQIFADIEANWPTQ